MIVKDKLIFKTLSNYKKKLEELIDLTNKYGNLIISNLYSPDELNSIEIYDTYRE